MKSLPLPMTIGASGVATASVALTPEQRAIVETGDGPVVVIAGAGTGKTRVIVERVRWLLETKGDLAGQAPPEGDDVRADCTSVDRDWRERARP